MRSRAQVRAKMQEIFAEIEKTYDIAQLEYAHLEENALENFDAEARESDVPAEKVLMIFANKHWRGIRSWVRGFRSQRENVRGRIKDLILYLVLLWVMADRLEDKM